MNPTNEQELRELAHIIMNADTPYDAMQFVKDHTNAEIAKAKLEAFDVAFDCHDYDRLRAYRAELLKEVK